MPTYAYACTACEHRFEIVQSFSDSSLTQCPECEGRLRKLFNAVGVVFKGSGFYSNDSRSTSRSGSGGSGKDSLSTAGSTSVNASSRESGSSSSDSSSSTSSDSSSSAGTTKTATKPASRSEGSAA